MASEDSDSDTKDDEKGFDIVDAEEEMRILSNYLTLRQSDKWNKKSISPLIKKAALIKEFPKNHNLSKTIIHKKRTVLELDKKNLSKTTEDGAIKSCKSIIDFVTKNKKDPLLEDYDEYKRRKLRNQNEEKVVDAELEKNKEAEEAVLTVCETMLNEQIKSNNGTNFDDYEEEAEPSKKCCKKNCKKRGKKILNLSNDVRSRVFGFMDLITDISLLLSSAQDPRLLVLTFTLLISICAPYIISYSSGVQLHLLTRSFNDLKGTTHLMLVLFLLPSGVFYYLFLDFVDTISTLIRWINFTIVGLEWTEIEKYEMSVSKAFGMDLTRWEGFKRQRKIGQLVFESLPQTIIQIVIFYFLALSDDDETSISDEQLALSIFFAASNSAFTVFKLALEAKCANCTFLSYALQCAKARNEWVPEMDKLKDRNGFMLQYKINKLYTHRLQYQFGTDTIRLLMAQLRVRTNGLVFKTSNDRICGCFKSSDNADDDSDVYDQNILNFGDTLRFLPLQDIIDLYEICDKKKIRIKSDVDWLKALKMSRNKRRDPRVLKHARDHDGVPYIMKLMKLTKSKALNGREILKFLIDEGFDLNLHDIKTNESVIHLLIRSFDYGNLRYIFQNYSKAKGVIIRLDYHSKNGISPLGVALELYEEEVKTSLKIKKTFRGGDVKDIERDIQITFLWQLLVDYGANLSFPCKIDSAKVETSPLFFVLRELKNHHLAREIMKEGARIYSKEICELNALFTGNEMNKLLCEVVKHCGRTIKSLADEFGNNPLHHFVNEYQSKGHKETVASLTSLISTCDEWRNMTNQEGYCPFQLVLIKRDSNLLLSFFECDKTFKKSIMKSKECVQLIIDWILSIMEKILRKYPSGISKEKAKRSSDADIILLNDMFKLKHIGRSIRWPTSKYSPNAKGQPISLIGAALDKKMIKAAKYLTKTWRIATHKIVKKRMKELEQDKEKRKLAESNLGSEQRPTMMAIDIKAINTAEFMMPVQRRTSAYTPGVTMRSKFTPSFAQVSERALGKQKSAFLTIENGDSKLDILPFDISDFINSSNITFRFEKICSFAVEVLSAADYITDILVLRQLIDNRESWWTSFMLLFMISPYLIAHSTMIGLVDTRLRSLKEAKCCTCDRCRLVGTKVLVWILLTPIAIVWFSLFDIIFIFHLFISALFLIVTFGQCNITDKLEDLFFAKLLNMSKIQIIGYRRLRSLSQLLFETVPQIALQLRILYEYRVGNTEIEIKEFEIRLSIYIALIHMVLEMSLIYLDAKASKISLSQYILICLGGRTNWVPFMQNIERDIEQLQIKESKEKKTYSFEKIVYKSPYFFGKEFQMEYEFTKAALQRLTTFFDSLPYPKSNLAPNNPLLEPLWLSYNQNEELARVIIGRISCRSLDLLSIAEFIRSANNKILLDTTDIDWEGVLKHENEEENNDVLRSLACAFTDYKLLSQLAQVWDIDALHIKMQIIATSASNILSILKKYSDEGIQCGIDSEISERLYKMIDDNEWIKSWAAIDSSYAFVIILTLWYTRRTIFHHQDAYGKNKFVQNQNRANFLSKVADSVLPKKFIVHGESAIMEEEDNEEIIPSIKNFSLNMRLSVKTSAEDDEKYDYPNEVRMEFEIVECFDYFHQDIENWIIHSLDNVHVIKNYIPRLPIKDDSLFRSFKKKMTEKHIDFIKLIINSSWLSIQQFPAHDLFPSFFKKLDKPIIRLGMVHGFAKYLLASRQFRQTQDFEAEFKEFNSANSQILEIDFDRLQNEKIEQEQKSVENEGGRTSIIELGASVRSDSSNHLLIDEHLKNKVKLLNVNDIVGISRIEVDFEVRKVDSIVASSGKIQILTILPQKTMIEDDELMLNKVVLKEVSFKDIMKNNKVAIDIYDNEVLGMFRPIYDAKKNEMKLMPLKVSIKPPHTGIKVKSTKVTFLTNKMKDFDQDLKNENVLNMAINLDMKEMVKFVSKYHESFDDNALDDRLQNALHILCSQSDPDLEVFDAVLSLKDIDINQARMDGKTPHQVLTNNLRISVDKKSEMLSHLTSHEEFKESIKFKKVLVVGTENSGRRSLLTHLRIQHEKRKYTQWQISVQKSKIHKFISLAMQKLIDECNDDQIKNSNDAKRVRETMVKSRYMERLKPKTLLCVKRLWQLEPIKIAASKLNDSSSVVYCFDERLDQIMNRHYVPSEQDLIRLLDDSVSIVTSTDEISQCHINWIGQSSAEKALKSSPLYDNIECVIFMVSLTALVDEINPQKAEQNALLESLSLFRQYCNDKRFERSKFVILFNKTDIFRKMVDEKHERLQQLVGSNKQIIDGSDYRQWLTLIQSMFRAQDDKRVIFAYPISLTDSRTVRPIIKVIEDIMMEPNMPMAVDETLSQKELLSDVHWIATLSSDFEVEIKSVSTKEIEKIHNDFRIDLNCMLFTDSDKNINYLIRDEFINDIWAKWCDESIKFYKEAFGYWQIINDDKDLVTLNAIFGVLQHKVLRIRFDGITMNKNPIMIKFPNDEKYEISWWNMARIGYCNALIINNSFYLNAEKVDKANNRNLIQWSWYDNDSGDLVEYDLSVLDQLECSYQANLQINFPKAIIKDDNDVFNHCILTDLMKYFEENHKNNSKFVLEFAKKDMELNSATQLSLKARDDHFSRTVQRKVNGRNVF